ncbi:pseudaminic acid cytidylyltransferase [Colwellia psychrerythraea]|uniref:Pseudaminic acid CMP-transferase n=1 Tax=Colwellia psychrerythraea TaxID=28229 RepID=A0A099L3J1_COLPS|nr:pseudaminic acid cytidylyltransferase [Colwellia psychrerythraea]KGJ97010.1 pseudaminic acid CMP-transferase [Colwellia psychrerythraea]
MNIAIIPARGGSKRIPRKNIKDFCGKPMIAYSIEAAKKSGCFERIIVSTDDSEIASVAKQYGAEVPFTRPDNISDDYASTLDVIAHAITELNLPKNTKICCIYATAPLISSDKLSEGLAIFNASRLDYVFSATEFSYPIQRAFKLSTNGHVEMFQPEHFNSRSQDLEQAYHDAGQFYWGSVSSFLLKTPIFGDTSKPIILPITQVKDIDTPDDWRLAEMLFNLG